MKLEVLAKLLNELVKNRPEFADKDICIEQTSDGESKLYVTEYDETSKSWTKLYWIKNLDTIKESIKQNMKKTYKVKNYKGNLVESLSRFQDIYKGMKIVEVVEVKDGLKIKVEEAKANKEDLLLTYDEQLRFKRWALKNYDIPGRDPFYFDSIDCVDAETAKNIPRIKCNGKLTWGQAAKAIEDYFKNKK